MAYTWPIYIAEKGHRGNSAPKLCEAGKTFLKFKYVEAYLVFEIWDGFTSNLSLTIHLL